MQTITKPEIQQSAENTPLRVAVVGAGGRSNIYASYALENPEKMKIVAVADPDDSRAKILMDKHSIAPDMRFNSYEQLEEHKDKIDAVINGTMDSLHFDSTLNLLKAGFDVLLEKPIAPSEHEVRTLIEEADKRGRKIMVCHVLRYAPFYERIKNQIESGALGDIVYIHTSEHVAYHHMASSFVRGKWHITSQSNPIMLAKCCHDLDLITWFLEGDNPKKVSSFGSLKFFKKEYAPKGATDRCLDGCPHEPTCAFSAKTLYVDNKLWQRSAFGSKERAESMTDEQKIEDLKSPNNLWGRCVWKCDNDVVDHQSVNIEFASGAVATHDLVGTSARASRHVHITGTKGELIAELHKGSIKVRLIDPKNPGYYVEKDFSLDPDREDLAGHGGGDIRLVADFVEAIRADKNNENFAPRTPINESLNGHLIAYAADTSMREGKTVAIDN